MIHTGPVKGDYTADGWKPTADTNPDFKCPKCRSNRVYFRMWESSDGAYDDIHYECEECKHNWWVEGIDS